jgi:peptidoglycan/xylan/chitin deacetylase (PgdA/CDA1 family)
MFDWPLQALRGITDGHEICVHTWSHEWVNDGGLGVGQSCDRSCD